MIECRLLVQLLSNLVDLIFRSRKYSIACVAIDSTSFVASECWVLSAFPSSPHKIFLISSTASGEIDIPRL